AAERQKLDRAYQMESHRAGLVQDPDPLKAMKFRYYVPPPRPEGFWQMSSVNRMWYCRMEELWQFRQEDLANKQAALAQPPAEPAALPAPRLLESTTTAKPAKRARAPRKPKRRKGRRRSCQ